MDVVVSIRSINTLSGEPESMEMISAGRMELKGGEVTLTYEESLDGETLLPTVLSVTDRSRALLRRGGVMEGTRMLIEEGKRHLCHYETGFGALTIGVFGEQIRSKVGTQGGTVRLIYTLDVNSQFSGRNEIEISVRPKSDVPLQ